MSADTVSTLERLRDKIAGRVVELEREIEAAARPHIKDALKAYLPIRRALLADIEEEIRRANGQPTPHYHQAKYVDDVLVRECGDCGRDLMDEFHIRRAAE